MTNTQPIDDLRTEERNGLVDALARSAFETVAVLSRISAEYDLSLTQLRVLAILRDRRLRMAGLADYLGLEKSTMTGLVDRAEKRGLVERAPSETDRRAIEVYLSAAGLALADEVEVRVAAALSPVTDALTPTERRRLRALLEKTLTTPPH